MIIKIGVVRSIIWTVSQADAGEAANRWTAGRSAGVVCSRAGSNDHGTRRTSTPPFVNERRYRGQAMSANEQRLSFGQAAAHYDSIRPTYPMEALDWLLGGEPQTVVDLGAGTGIFSRVLAAAGHQVIAVEPDPLMRDRLVAVTPSIRTVAGSAEHIPLLDSSVDAVVAAQSYHWFDRPQAHPEIARVLRQGGRFGVIWNIRDESVPWVAAFGRAASLEDGTTGMGFWRRMPDAGPWFETWERGELRHALVYSPSQLLDLARSRSTWLAGDKDTRQRIDDGVTAVIADLPEHVEVSYVTVAYRARRSPLTPLSRHHEHARTGPY